MRVLPSRARLAGLGLAVAAATIIALAISVLLDLDREARVHREVALAQQVKDDLHEMRLQVLELRSAARLGARTGDATAYANIERRAADLERGMATLEKRAADGALLPGMAELGAAARMLIVHARSVRGVRAGQGPASAAALAQEAERLSVEATNALERSLAIQTQQIAVRTDTQLQLGEGLRRYIAGMLAGSFAMLAGLVVAYRRVQGRERRAQLHIEHLAHFDMVTGLPNRALLADRLAQETARSRRGSLGFAVMLFDLDGFKSVNDTWGHAAGDRVLALVAERARKCVRASDTVGRLGGDEFFAILPETSLAGAQGVAAKLGAALAEPYLLDGGTARLSASVGIAMFPESGSDPEQLQRAADAALYRAKRDGKNRVVVADAAAEPSRARDAA
ncbi:MAG: diguanylate cyclase domain-containing protein [Usitatibacter sp.]